MINDPIIIFEDENVLAVNKPAGMIVNKADTAKGMETLQEWVENKFPIVSTQLSEASQYMVDGYDKAKEFRDRGGIVHRLDKETSGVIIIAKNVETFINLQGQFKSGKVQKTYRALVHGRVEPKTGKIHAPIGRLPWNRMRFGVLPEGRDAETDYLVLEYKQDGEVPVSLVEVYPKTGRTHQIRVHFQYINYPVYSDALYAGRKKARDDRKKLDRHFLHAYKITLENPATNAPMEVIAGLPSDLKSFFATLLTPSS